MAKRTRGIQCDAKIGGRLMFPKKYLCADDLQGRDATVTIKAVKGESLQTEGGDTESKWLVSFEGKDKRLVLNKTNTKAIAVLHGNNADDWVGKRITLYPTRCASFGDMVDCIRVRDKVPTGKPTQQDSGDFGAEMAGLMDDAA